MNIQKRLFINQLYQMPIYKSKFWHSHEVFNENTPLLKDNLSKILKNYTKYSEIYDTLHDYLKNCVNKDHPHVVGLEGIDHWIAIEKNGSRFLFIDSSGCPKDAYVYKDVPDLPPITRITATEAGHIRQSPMANSCGLYALTFCLGYELAHNGYFFWDQYAPRTINYNPVTLNKWIDVYMNSPVDYELYSNDLNLSNFYKQIDGHD